MGWPTMSSKHRRQRRDNERRKREAALREQEESAKAAAALGPPEGGKGEPRIADELQISAKAVRERWLIQDQVRVSLPEELASIVTSKESTPRNKISAARVLLSADSINLDAEKHAADDDKFDTTIEELDHAIESELAFLASRGQAATTPTPEALEARQRSLPLNGNGRSHG